MTRPRGRLNLQTVSRCLRYSGMQSIEGKVYQYTAESGEGQSNLETFISGRAELLFET